MSKKKTSKKKTRRDVAEIARSVVEKAIGEQLNGKPQEEAREKNPAAVELGKLGASKGGKARAKKLSKKRRTEIAKKAAAARWGNHD